MARKIDGVCGANHDTEDDHVYDVNDFESSGHFYEHPTNPNKLRMMIFISNQGEKIDHSEEEEPKLTVNQVDPFIS